MTDRNKKVLNEMSKENVLKQFTKLSDTLQKISDKAKTVMPLVSDSLQLTIKIVDTYREAYTVGLEIHDKKKK